MAQSCLRMNPFSGSSRKARFSSEIASVRLPQIEIVTTFYAVSALIWRASVLKIPRPISMLSRSRSWKSS